MTLHGNVGVAPGTTTIMLDGYPMQDPGVRLPKRDPIFFDWDLVTKPPSPTKAETAQYLTGHDLGYFDARPTDFAMQRILNYVPVRRGWISGRLSGAGPCCSGCAVGDSCTASLGVSAETKAALAMLGIVAGGAVGGAIGGYFADRGRGAVYGGLGGLFGTLGSFLVYRLALS